MTTLALVGLSSGARRGMQEVTAGQGVPADVLSYVESCRLALAFSRVSASDCDRAVLVCVVELD